jgi:urease accessory protein UreE
LQEYFDRIAHQIASGIKDKSNAPEITPEQDGLEAIVLKPSLHLGNVGHHIGNNHEVEVKSA